jgi:hypothetical protein
MFRSRIVLLVGALFTLLGAVLQVEAGPLATRWQPLGEGAWGGTTDPALRQSYQALGLALLAFGLSLVAMAVARWLFLAGSGPSSRTPVGGA